jgi:hypothetical protein
MTVKTVTLPTSGESAEPAAQTVKNVILVTFFQKMCL